MAGVLRTSSLSLGPKVEEFEHAISSYVGASEAVAVSSGTSGLHLCIRALGISEGDEVIVPSFAFIAVANSVLYEKAIPVFVDIDPQTLQPRSDAHRRGDHSANTSDNSRTHFRVPRRAFQHIANREAQ